MMDSPLGQKALRCYNQTWFESKKAFGEIWEWTWQFPRLASLIRLPLLAV